MKQKLLLMALFVMTSLGGFAQAEAYPVPDIAQCGNEVFNLTAQETIALGGQDPENFTVTYHTSWEDAENNTNPIANPESYIIASWPEQALYIRVSNNLDGSFDTTSFVISIGMMSPAPEMEDVTVCGSYQIPYLNEGQIYTGPDGTGVALAPGSLITVSTTLYIYVSNACGTDETTYTVTVNEGGVAIAPLDPLYECDDNADGMATFNLEAFMVQLIATYPEISGVTFYETYDDALYAENQIMNIANYLNINALVQTVYCRILANGCVSVMPLQLVATICETDNTISGHVMFDDEGDGCDENDVPAVGAMVYYLSGNTYNFAYTDSEGYYSFSNVPNASVIVYVNTYYPIPSSSSPTSIEYAMPDNIEGADFCLTAPEPVDDVSIFITPTSAAQPGFAATYALIYQNFGTSAASGEVTLEFDDTLLDFVSASPSVIQTGNTLTFSYSDLAPYQSGYIYIEFTVAVPPTVEMGDILTFTANVTPLEGDDYPENNTYVLDQLSTNSWDPNDIRCHEGESITETQADGYLYYTIRFQNEGDMAATTVRIDETLSPLLNVETFDPLASSHNFQVNRSGSAITFTFNNINLDYADNDEAASQGYVTYKIKPVSTIALGNEIHAQAGIYFDFNPVVPTPVYTTTVENTAGVEDIALNGFVLYPNPASGTVYVDLADAIRFTVTITDVLGKTILANTFDSNKGAVNVSSLNSGVYFITANAEGKTATQKLIIK